MPDGARRGRPRQPGLDDRLEAAALELLRTGGPTAVTVEGVAARAGVAKTSIYRRHDNRAALLTTALSHAIGSPSLPEDGPPREKLRSALEQTWRQMDDVLGPGGLAAIVGNTDPEFTEVFRAALRPYDEALVSLIRHDVEVGLLRADLDADAVVGLLLGAPLGELVRQGRVMPDWLDRSLELLWGVMAPPGG